MRLEDLRVEPTDRGARAAATVVWEDARRPTQTLVFEAEAADADGLGAGASSFLTAVAYPAAHAREARIAVAGAVCPRLAAGLATVLRTLAGWYPGTLTVPRVEPRDGFVAPVPAPTRRAALFLSGGVDSLDALREAAAAFPPGHPRAVRDLFFVHGLDIGAPRQAPRERFFARARARLEEVAAAVGARLVPVWTNVRTLEPVGKAWPAAWFGPGTVAVAHAFDRRVTEVGLAASLDVEGLGPVGSHPATDPYLSSAALDVRHEGVHRSRLEKLRALVAWAPARDALRVCWQEVPEDGPLNCGGCRKCVRVRLGLEALGATDAFPTFPAGRLGPEALAACTVDAHMVGFYRELVAPLRARGRADLADGLAARLAAFEAARAPRSLWGRLRRRWARR